MSDHIPTREAWLFNRRVDLLRRWRNWRARRHDQQQQRYEQCSVRKQERRRRAQSLQSKLTRSYLWVTVLAVLAVELFVSLLVLAMAAVEFRPAFSPSQAGVEATKLANRLTPLARSSGMASLQTQSAAAMQKKLDEPPREGVTLVVTTTALTVLAASHSNQVQVGRVLKNQAITKAIPASEIVALAKEGTSQSVARRTSDGGSIAVAPIRVAGSVVGLAWVRSVTPDYVPEFLESIFGILIASAILVSIFASVVGAGFGWFTARRLTHRLAALEAASAAWGRGDFDVVAIDEADDEIGQLARRLNVMAQELRELVALRQNLATAEERNHLARELHDTVKQQVFATTMQIGAAKALLDRSTDTDHDLALTRLATAEELARGAQSELTAILEQLRPGSYSQSLQGTREATAHSSKGHSRDWLVPIRRYADEWSRQSGIPISFECNIHLPALSIAASQSILRLVQEGLANIARHSNATHSSIRFRLQDLPDSLKKTLILEIVDNGCGFELDSRPYGLGLQSMRERAEALPEGSLIIASGPGKGTRLRVCCRYES